MSNVVTQCDMMVFVFILAYLLCALIAFAVFVFVAWDVCKVMLRRPVLFLLLLVLGNSGAIWFGHVAKVWMNRFVWTCPVKIMGGHAYWLVLHLSVPLVGVWWIRRCRKRLVKREASVGISEIWDNEVKLCLTWLVLAFSLCLYLGTKAGIPMSATIIAVLLSILTLWLLVWNYWASKREGRVCMLPPDSGISAEMSDKLQRDRSFDKLYQWLQNGAGSLGRVVGIFGRWGSGKTFLVHYLASRLEKFHFVSVNLWQCSNEMELQEHVLKALETAYFGRYTPTTYLTQFLRYLLFVGTDGYGLLGVIGKSFHILNEDARSDKITCFKKAVENKKVILVLDNVERTEVDILNALLPLVERLRGLPGLTILLSVAMEAWNYGGRQRMMKGHVLNGAIQKIVEYPYHMTALKQSHARSFFLHCLRKEGLSDDCASALLAEMLEFDTPRQIVRVAQALAVCEGVYFDSAWNRERNMLWLHNGFKEKVLPLVKPILLLTILRSQYAAMYTLLSEQASSWIGQAPLPDLKEVSLGRVAEQKSAEDEGAWYIEMLRSPLTKGYNNKLRYKMLAEEVLDYTHDLLFTSVLRQLNKQSAMSFLDAMNQTYAYQDELHPLKVLYIVQKSQTSGDVRAAIKSCFEILNDKIDDSLIIALTQYVMGFINSSLREQQTETPNYVFVFMKLVSLYPDMLFNHLKEQLNGMITTYSAPYFLSYPYMSGKKNDEYFAELEDFIRRLDGKRKAVICASLIHIVRLDSCEGIQKCIWQSRDDFKTMVKQLYPFFEKEMGGSVPEWVWPVAQEE